MERALAASNAQFDDADILRRLDIRLLPIVRVLKQSKHEQATYLTSIIKTRITKEKGLGGISFLLIILWMFL